MKTWTMIAVCGFLALSPASAFEREDYEEEAGGTFLLVCNPTNDIYGFGFGSGTWLKNTPVFGDFALTLFSHGTEDSWYSAATMSLRVMPHWRVAPFAGGGGSYNYSLSGSSEEENRTLEPGEPVDRGASYWGGHAEAGVRISPVKGIGLLELMGRYVWTSLEGDRNYWLIGVSVGMGL